jgi:hypothetical protein
MKISLATGKGIYFAGTSSEFKRVLQSIRTQFDRNVLLKDMTKRDFDKIISKSIRR